MEPRCRSSRPVRDEKNKVMRAIRPIDPRASGRARCAASTAPASSGTSVPGYRQEKGVAPDSKTETYAR